MPDSLVGTQQPSTDPFCCAVVCCAVLCVGVLPQDLKFVGMMQYDGDLLLPANYLVPPPEIHKTSGEYLVHNGISTFACSETQKFGHVTFFWNGNRSGYFDSKLETYLEVGVRPTQRPGMSRCLCRSHISYMGLCSRSVRIAKSAGTVRICTC